MVLPPKGLFTLSAEWSARTRVGVKVVIVFSEFDYNGHARLRADTRVSARSVNSLLGHRVFLLRPMSITHQQIVDPSLTIWSFKTNAMDSFYYAFRRRHP